MINLKYIEVNQPIGTFYICSVDSDILIRIAEVRQRSNDVNNVQRDESSSRVKEIADFCNESDAVFPTPIIISVDADANVEMNESEISLSGNEIIGEVIDGQHRLLGISKSKSNSKFQLPVVFMFGLESSHKAYIFSIINSKQTRVNMSLIYDLFSFSEHRSPYKTCHEIARSFNNDEDSPYFNRMKMLGKKTSGQEIAAISQGSFIKFTLELITRDAEKDSRILKSGVESLQDDSKCPLRSYFIDKDDVVIYKIIKNYLKAVSVVFHEEWNNPEKYIISKSIGYGALVKAFPEFYKIGLSRKTLDVQFFTYVMDNIKTKFNSEGKELTSKYYGSNEQARSKLAFDLIKSCSSVDFSIDDF